MGAVRAPTIAVAWLCATAAAVGVSWLGVRTVVHDAALTPLQLAVPVSSVGTGTPPPTPDATSVTPTPTPSVRPTTVPPSAPTTRSKAASTSTAPTSPSTTANSTVHSYTVTGGQVVLSLDATSATLVSATPADGYSVQVWQESGWLRVDFSNSAGTTSLFATWNGHPPSVQTYQS
jgi:hypothetical protein